MHVIEILWVLARTAMAPSVCRDPEPHLVKMKEMMPLFADLGGFRAKHMLKLLTDELREGAAN